MITAIASGIAGSYLFIVSMPEAQEAIRNDPHVRLFVMGLVLIFISVGNLAAAISERLIQQRRKNDE